MELRATSKYEDFNNTITTHIIYNYVARRSMQCPITNECNPITTVRLEKARAGVGTYNLNNKFTGGHTVHIWLAGRFIGLKKILI